MRLFFALLAAIILISVSSLPSVSADLGYTCVGNSSFYNWTEDGVVHNMTTPCLQGCSNGACNNDTSDGSFPMAFILAYAVIAGIMAFLAMNMDKEQHGHIQILFIFLSLYSVISCLGATQVIIDLQGIPMLGSANLAIFTAFFWSSWFVLAYIILVFIRNLIMAIQEMYIEKKAKKRGGLRPLEPI